MEGRLAADVRPAVPGTGLGPIVLVVDASDDDRHAIEELLGDLRYDVRHARGGAEALEAIAAEEPDLILIDVRLPGMTGLALCQRLKADPRRRLIPVVLLTGDGDRGVRLQGFAAGADEFLTKPIDVEELRVRARVLLRERTLNKELDAAGSVILALARAVEARDRYTVHHAERVGRYAREIGRAFALPDDELDVLYMGGVLHDVGKIGIPAEILLKAGELTSVERAVLETHSAEGERICLPLRSTVRFLPIIRHHHERIDGSGYPDHLVGTAIPLHARIAAVADVWDAMVSDRPYRLGLDRDVALRALWVGAGRQYDATFVELFVELLQQGIVDRIAADPYGNGSVDLPR